MKRILVFCFVFLVLFQSKAQRNYEPFVKTLSQTGLPSYYSNDLRVNIDSWVSNKDDVVSAMLGKFQAYEKDLEYITKEFGLPWFIKYIPAANTGLNVHFQSEIDGAKGIWPIEYQIAKKYNLVSNSYEDERLSFLESSETACEYIKALYGIYKDWQKTILAFRIGPVRVNQLIRTHGTVHLNDFYDKLSDSEKEPINQFYAAMTVFHYADTFGIKPIPYKRILIDTASCSYPATFETIERFTGIPQQTLKTINPSLLRNAVPAVTGPNCFNIPKDLKKVYEQNRDTIETYTKYTIHPPTIYDTLVNIIDSIEYIDLVKRPFGDFSPGKRTIVSIQNTKRDSTTGSNTNPHLGTEKPNGNNQVIRIISSDSTQNQEVRMVWVRYTVKRKDALYSLSDVFDCTIQQTKKWNNMRGNGIYIGQKLKFKVPENKLAYYKKINKMTLAQKAKLAKKDR